VQNRRNKKCILEKENKFKEEKMALPGKQRQKVAAGHELLCN
jgi:hypothetical protein